MKKELTRIEDITEISQVKEPPTFWKWYFSFHPRLFLTIPAFLLFVYQGLWFVIAEIQDILYFFHTKPITWGSILLVLLFGSILIWFILAPIYICLYSISWLYEVNIGKYSAWRKFLYSIGIVLLVSFGPGLIRLFTSWILGIF